MKFSLFAVFAHPDDEAFGVGGTLARYAADGVQVTLACATRGEVGEISDPTLATPETLGKVRTQELHEACAALGIPELRFLGYRDSGMPGAPENDDPRCYTQADPETATRQLVALMREVKPHVVITFDPGGGYGHPDHVAVSRHTTAAFDLASDTDAYPEAGRVWRPQRLFYTAFPRSVFRELREQMAAQGVDTSQLDQFDIEQFGHEDAEITHVFDARPYLDAKWAALRAHRTQFGGDNPLLQAPEAVTRQMMAREYFIQARPVPQPARGGVKPDDFFEGIN